ncbi:MAG TPA: xanthine dehydrogenase family protein subunit M [Rhizomicrobium sp.]|jgi:carbon-monoxide dehydrogenase medium subunit|nr:xanthine dehydrogenase family protein subunit M [Rhizomicrobium sp.]
MIPYAFHYHRAASLDDAQTLFANAQEAKFLAGGQTLIPAMKQRLSQPSDLIDIGRLAELSFIHERDGNIVIGAMARHGDVAASALVRSRIPALAELAEEIGDPAVRHMGTLGGSLATSDPAADYPAGVLGLGANVVTTKKTVPADDYFLGLFQTPLEDGEIITEVSFPIPRRAGYAKFRNPASHYAMVGVFVGETSAGVRVAVTGAGACAFRVAEMETALARRFDAESVAGISLPADGLNSDLHASAEYRAHLVTVMARRAVAAAIGR